MPKKIIVTHIFPDFDAVTAAWLLVRFDPEFAETGLEFVPAGSTYQNMAADSDPTVVHVDTGMGRFDHHQETKKTCAAELVFNDLLNRKLIKSQHGPALKRLIVLVVAQDNFEDFFWPDSANDRYDLFLAELINNLKISGKLTDKELAYQSFLLLDAVFTGLLLKTKAEADIASGQEFSCFFGRGLAVGSKHSLVSKLAQKMGYRLVVRQEPGTGFVSVKSQPIPEIDLTGIYRLLVKADSQATWFFHQSRHIISNGSRHNPNVKASRLTLVDLVEIVKKYKEVE